MKALLMSAALATIVFTGPPAAAQLFYGQQSSAEAFAQSPVPRTRPGVRRTPAVNLLTHPDGRWHSDNPANDVYDTQGVYIGSDPDPFIRNELMRSPPHRDDN